MIRLTAAFVLASLPAYAERPGLFFREDWKRTPPATPLTQAHVDNPELIVTVHGGGRDGIKKSHHEKPADDPYYAWSGEANGNWAVTLRHRSSAVDLTGQAKIRWRTKQSGFRELRIVLQLADGAWLVSDQGDGPSEDWREREFPIADLRWRRLDIDKIVESRWVDRPDLSKVEEIGFTDLMSGGGSPASSRVDWIEVYGGPSGKRQKAKNKRQKAKGVRRRCARFG